MYGGSGLNRLRKVAAVHPDVGSRDKAAGLVAGKEHGGADQFLRFAETSHRGMAHDGVGALGGGAVLVEKDFTVLFGREETGGDGIDADAGSGLASS